MTLRDVVSSSSGSDASARTKARHAWPVRVAPVFVRPVLEEAERVGADPDRLCRGLGVSAADMDMPGITLSHDEAITVIRRALPAINRHSLGLELGRRCNLIGRGVQALGLMASDTLGSATALALRFPSTAGYLLALYEGQCEGKHVITADSLPGDHDVQPFLADHLFSSIVNARRYLTSTNYSASSIELVRPRPANAADYEDYFKCPVRFGCHRNRLTTDGRWMEYPLPTANIRSYRLALQLLEREATAGDGKPPIVLSVERMIRRELPRVATLAEVAAALNVSDRTLRRRLAEADVTYQSLLDDIRKSRALELVVNGRTPLPRIATQTGFSDARAFRRAFKRWTGRAPAELRK